MSKMKIPLPIKKARQYVIEHEDELREKYGKKYIAVAGNVGVIDADENEQCLNNRINENTHTSIDILVLTIDQLKLNTEEYICTPIEE